MLKLFICLGLFYGTVFSNVATDNSECIGKSNGIFVSSSDCSTFIMCSGGFQTVHKCPEPLLFSPNLLVCDWAQNVKCGQLEGVGAEEAESSGGNASNFDCTDLNSGLYPNPEDCTTFFECSNGDGYIFDCPPGLIFDPTYLICNWPSESNVCHEVTRPPTTTTTERVNTTTTELEVPTTELPEEETTQPPQEETTLPAVTEVTEDNSGESGEETTQNSVTQTEDDGSSEEGGEQSTTESSSEEGEGGETTESSSEEETTEAATTVKTTTTTTTTTTVAPKFCVGKPNGLYPNPTDCTSFYKCTNQYTYLINCPAGNYFDPEKVGCFDDPSVCDSLTN